jgi:hypothetical protein
MNKYKSTYHNAQPSARYPPSERLDHHWIPMLEGWKVCKYCECRWWAEKIEVDPLIRSDWLYKYLWADYNRDHFYTKDGVEYGLSPRCKMYPKATPRKGFRT